MADDVRSPRREEPELDGSGLRIAVVCSRFNDRITERLLDGARRGLAEVGVASNDVSIRWVPGAFELPVAAQAFAASGRVDAVVCLGCVIRGETTHYEEVAGQCSAGIMRVQLDTSVPVIFGVLTTEDLDQALARSEGPSGHNVGHEGAVTAVEMARTLAAIRHPAG